MDYIFGKEIKTGNDFEERVISFPRSIVVQHVVEFQDDYYSAYVPSLPGCTAAAETLQDTLAKMKDAIEAHLSALKEDGIEEAIDG